MTKPLSGVATCSKIRSSSASTCTESRPKHTVHWFRRGLRLHDNPSLRAGIANSATFRCIFIIDPWFAGSSNVGINKWRFLLQCLEDLDRSLRKINSRLFVIRGQPADALPKLFKQWGTTSLTFEKDPEPFGRTRDLNIMAMCKELGVHVVTSASHTLYDLEQIISRNGGSAPLTYHTFQKVVSSMQPPPQPEEPVISKSLRGSVTPLTADHDSKYGVPTLEELGFDTDRLRPAVWYGGETEALARLERHLERKAWIASFGKPKMTPQSLLASTTGLTPYLRFGCLSTRLFYHQLTDLYKKIRKASPPLSLHGQLLWREFFYCAATHNPNFDRMVCNPICVQIPWDRQPEALAKWANGQTGFPWIDAIMTQLREEGWIHHLARHAAACFLTRGDLWLSWEDGMKVFDELLLDADWSVNAGMWMWLSCSSFFQQFFHYYCPVRFGRKSDPNGDYIRRYLPVLKNFPTKWIHEPWLAPIEEQKAARCVIGQDFPQPMVDHVVVSKINIERMKQVYRHLAKYRVQAIINSGVGRTLLFKKPTVGMIKDRDREKKREVAKTEVKSEHEPETNRSFNETKGSFNETKGSFNETKGSFNETKGSFNETKGSFNETKGSFNETKGSFNETKGSFMNYRIMDAATPPLAISVHSPAPGDGDGQEKESRAVESHSSSMNSPFQHMDLHTGSPKEANQGNAGL